MLSKDNMTGQDGKWVWIRNGQRIAIDIGRWWYLHHYHGWMSKSQLEELRQENYNGKKKWTKHEDNGKKKWTKHEEWEFEDVEEETAPPWLPAARRPAKQPPKALETKANVPEPARPPSATCRAAGKAQPMPANRCVAKAMPVQPKKGPVVVPPRFLDGCPIKEKQMQACEEAESEGEWEPYELESHCDADESSPGSNRTNNKQKAAGPRKVENEEIVKARIRKAAAQKAKDFMESKQFTHADGHSKQVQKHPNKDTQEVPAKELQKKQQKKAVDAKKITGSKEDKSNRPTEASDLLILFLCSQFP